MKFCSKSKMNFQYIFFLYLFKYMTNIWMTKYQKYRKIMTFSQNCSNIYDLWEAWSKICKKKRSLYRERDSNVCTDRVYFREFSLILKNNLKTFLPSTLFTLSSFVEMIFLKLSKLQSKVPFQIVNIWLTDWLYRRMRVVCSFPYDELKLTHSIVIFKFSTFFFKKRCS